MPTAAIFDPASVVYVDEMYQQFLNSPESLTPEWRAYFMGFGAGAGGVTGGAKLGGNIAEKGNQESEFARVWRERGHLVARINPLAEHTPALLPELKAESYGLDSALTTKWRDIYGGFVGVECAVLGKVEERLWVQEWWESERPKVNFETQTDFYKGLVQANGLEQFLHKKFVGAKRFSLEGNDVVIPLLHQLAETAAAAGIKNMVMGMAHRGRLNVLCNILHKPYEELFAAFGDKLTPEGGPSSGDVKYHAGKVYQHAAKAGPIELQLLYNPSHLEAVNPSVLGVARAKNDANSPSLPILMHGDSAVAGQGVVAETNNLMALAAYNVGGTLHIIINNQIGFTADAADAFSGTYCTDIFKSLGCPIVHVNADHPEACWRALRFCFEYRQTFGKDAVLDVVGYRRWGHNEGDDPTFTQPKMYEAVRAHPVPAEVYKAHLLQSGVTAEALQKVEQACATELDAAFAEAQKGIVVQAKSAKAVATDEPETGAEAGEIKRLAEAWATPPAGFKLNEKVGKVVEERVAMLRGEKSLNWGAAETAAYGCLLQNGISVRMTGQDVQRGTFSHRHAVLTDAATNAKWNVLQGVAKNGTFCLIANSVLSENAVMAYEYGYALANPAALVLWEAQFGDFANGAQVVIDQFLSSAEAKWGQHNGLTLLLPHGYEGQGPEHSSARLERFLQLCAEENMTVAYPSTPAQIFHLLRRQALHSSKKPLVVMTPKSLLRNPAAVSPLSDLLRGGWQPVIGEDLKSAKKVVLCSGKIYYELAARREAEKRSDVALLRLEQFYPWPAAELGRELGALKAKQVLWVQEEPKNMGAWTHVLEYWDAEWGYLHYVGRPASASPAAGTTTLHALQQAEILDGVFGELKAKKVA